MKAYSLNEIQEIKENINSFCLDNEVNDTLHNLCNLLGLNNVTVKQKQMKKERILTNENNIWKKQEPFKTTVFEKKEGVDSLLNNLRGVLNKISKKNYLEQEEQIQKIINEIIEFKENEVDNIDEKFNKIFNVFYRVLINNKVHTNLYAQLFNFFCEEYYQFEDFIDILMERYRESIKIIDYCDPEEDYDKYCSINKLNEERKSLYGFLIVVSGSDVCSFSDILEINETLFSYLEDNIENVEKQNINEEIVENISVFITEGKDKILKDVSKYSIEQNLIKYSQLKDKSKVGFSNRMRFKFMDLVEYFKKKN
jgi:hypothetical protein